MQKMNKISIILLLMISCLILVACEETSTATLQISGDYQTSYFLDQEFSSEGMIVTYKQGDFMGSWLIELISNLIDITGNPIADTVIFAIIGLISGSLAFGLTCFISNTTRSYNSRSMSDIHWGVRVVLFVVLTYLIAKIVELIKWIFMPPALYFLICIIILIVVFFILLKVFKKPVNKEIDELVNYKPENNKNEKKITENVIIRDLRKCPYCGGLLVERQGPYGNFLGCSNFPDCKYTRNE